MLQVTVNRLAGWIAPANIWVITGARYVALVREQCPQLPAGRVIGEPMPRDTAAAIALGAALVRAQNPQGIMVVLSADHVIRDVAGFRATISRGIDWARRDEFVTIGIRPTYPAEIYGYLQRGAALDEHGAHVLRSFVEKPSRTRAEAFLPTGEYFWNAGMFVWKAAQLLEEMKKHLPEHADMACKIASLIGPGSWPEEAVDLFAGLKKISIDFGLMEKLARIVMLEARFDWNDAGGWLALEDILGRDAQGNVLRGMNVVHDVRNNIIITQNDRRPTLVSGVQDCIIVNADAGTLVCHRSEIERIRGLVQQIIAG